MVDSYGTHYPSNSPALGNLLNKASQIRGADGRPSAEAIDLFLNSIDRTQRNNHTKEAVKSFFRNHTDAVLDRLPKSADGFLTTESYNRLTRLPDGLGFPRLGTDASSILGARDWLRNNSNSSKLQAEFLHRMMNDETGRAMLRMTGGFSDADKQLYANAINAAYSRNPQVTLQQIRNVGDTYIGAIQGAGQGFPEIIAKTGNYDIINSYATHLLEEIKATDAYRQGGYGSILGFDAGAALTGLSSDQLQRFLSEHATDDLTRVLTNTLGSNRYPSTALGQLLRTASQIEVPYYDPARGGLSYKISDEALRFFADAVPNLGDNAASREGAGAFFVENPVAVVDILTDTLGRTAYSREVTLTERLDVLRDFFGNVVFGEEADSLRYNNRPLSEAIGGVGADGRFTGRGGALAQVSEVLHGRALSIAGSRLSDTEKSRQLKLVGNQLGYIMGAMQAGLLQVARDAKEEAEFRAGLFGAMAASLASPVPYAGVASDLIGFFTEEIAKNLMNNSSYESVNQILRRSTSRMLEELDRFEQNRTDGSVKSGYIDGLTFYLTEELIRQLLR